MVVGVAFGGVALRVGVKLETEEGKMVVVVVKGECSGFGLSTGVALENRPLKAAMLRAQTESCMIFLCIEKKNISPGIEPCCWLVVAAERDI